MVDGWKKKVLKVWYFLFFIFKSKYVKSSQWDYNKKIVGFIFYFFVFSYEIGFEWFFLQFLKKNTYSYPNISHVFVLIIVE